VLEYTPTEPVNAESLDLEDAGATPEP
jgi:hypothetical protein